jgi:hypothetical protein
MFAVSQDLRRKADFPWSDRKFRRGRGVHLDVQPIALGHSAEQPAQTTVDGPAVRRRTGRQSTAGAPRTPRHARVLDRRSALKSLAAELSAAAATIEGGLPTSGSELFALTEPTDTAERPRVALSVVDLSRGEADIDEPAGDSLSQLREELNLTGHRDVAWTEDHAVPAVTTVAADAPSPAAPDSAPLHVTAHVERLRAETDVLSARVESEQAARAEAERRLADAQDELRFLRAEMQMVGQKRRRGPGRFRRALRLLTGRRRPVVPANTRKSA